MPRTMVCLGVLAIVAVPCRAGQTISGQETLVRLSVAPAPAPVPALRYRLLPDLMEMDPGNPIQGYFRALLAHEKFFLEEEASGRAEALLAMPLRALPAQEAREYGRRVLVEADRAARLDRPDWQILPKVKTDGFSLLLPDVQQMRSLVRGLQVRFRGEVAMGHFDEALRTVRTMLAIARHLGEHPSLIGNLVGIATASTTIDALEEMLEQPGCPNLYWALTTLPHPFIALAVGMEGERAFLLGELRALDDEAPMSADRIRKFRAHWDAIFDNQKPAKPGQRVREWLDARLGLDAARRRLVASGLPEERLRRFPAEQVILLDEKRECLVHFDDVMKLMTLPSWQIEPRIAQLMRNKAPSRLADKVLPFATPARRAQGRLDQRIALLRHVEALRLHASEHRGALPGALADVEVPLPDDPVTGKPFPYELRDGTAHLRGAPPPGEEKNPSFNVHVAVSLSATDDEPGAAEPSP